MGRLLLVRHGRPETIPDVAPARWPLARDGASDLAGVCARLGLTGASIVASTERKAFETAQAVSGDGQPVASDPSFDEVRRPWIASPADHHAAVAGYLAGDEVDGWEPQADAAERFRVGIERHRGDAGLVVVTHGTVMTNWLNREVGLAAPGAFWSGLLMPDVWEVDLTQRSLARRL